MRASEVDLARARYIRAVLAWHGHTQTDLGRILGIHQVTASQKLRGVRTFKPNELLALAEAYGLDPGTLLRPPQLDDILGTLTESARDLLTSTNNELVLVRTRCRARYGHPAKFAVVTAFAAA